MSCWPWEVFQMYLWDLAIHETSNEIKCCFYFYCCKFWLWSDVLVQNYCSAKFCQHCILCLLPVLPYQCNYFDFFIITHIFKRACMDLFMSLATVAPSISTQMLIQKCLPSIMCTSFHSLFLIYELKLIAKGSLSCLAVSAPCWLMQSKNLLCIFKSATLLGAQDDCPLIAVYLCCMTTWAGWKQWKSFSEQHNMPKPVQTYPFLCFQVLCFQTFAGTNNISKRTKPVGM